MLQNDDLQDFLGQLIKEAWIDGQASNDLDRSLNVYLPDEWFTVWLKHFAASFAVAGSRTTEVGTKRIPGA